MKVLTTSTNLQTIKVIPRVFTNSIVLKLRDDSTNDKVSFILPETIINKDYLEISNIFNLKEGRFYDLTIYKVNGSYEEFKQRVISDSGTFVNNTCLYNFLDAQNLINTSSLDIIYLDKIFCTDQTINQDTNNYYSVNKDEYVSKSGNNDYIVL
jgi:hypothetical protein